MRSAIKDLIAQGKKRLVLDLESLSYIDSAGLGTLVAAYTSARSSGADIKLANITQKLDELLNITKLVTVFSVYASVDEAIKSFS